MANFGKTIDKSTESVLAWLHFGTKHFLSKEFSVHVFKHLIAKHLSSMWDLGPKLRDEVVKFCKIKDMDKTKHQLSYYGD